MKNLGKRFILGMVSGAGSVFTKHILNILLLPVLIHLLGVKLFSLYMILVGILELTLLMDLGFTESFVKLLAATHDQESPQDPQRPQRLMKLAHFTFGGIAVFILLASLVIVPNFPNMVHLDPDMRAIAQAALAIVMVEGALTFYTTYFRAILFSHCLHQWNHIGDMVLHLTSVGLGILLLLSGHGLLGVVIARLAGAVLKTIIAIFTVLRVERHALWNRIRVSFSLFREMISLTLHAMVLNLSIVVSHKIDTLIIASVLPLFWVGYFEIVFRLLGSILMLCLKIGEGVFPVFANLISKSETGSVRQLFLRMSCFNNFLVGILLLLIVCFYPELFGFFSAGKMDIELTYPILAIGVPLIWSSAVQLPACHFLFTSGHQQFLSISSVITAVSNLVLSLLLVGPLGIVGVALGTLIPQFLQHQFSLIQKACEVQQISLREYLGAVHAKVFILLLGSWLFIEALKPWGAMIDGGHPLLHVILISAVIGPLSAGLWFLWTASDQEKTFFVLKIVTPLKKSFSLKKVPLHG